jgi:hypothetical protein
MSAVCLSPSLLQCPAGSRWYQVELAVDEAYQDILLNVFEILDSMKMICLREGTEVLFGPMDMAEAAALKIGLPSPESFHFDPLSGMGAVPTGAHQDAIITAARNSIPHVAFRIRDIIWIDLDGADTLNALHQELDAALTNAGAPHASAIIDLASDLD